jgi:hypothetical protein
MMTGRKTKAARALPGSGVSLKTSRRMEATPGVVRANADTRMKVVDTLDGARLAIINADSATVEGGRGIQSKSSG